jgi:transcriptional regulator
MYVPHFNAVEDQDEIRRMVRAIGAAQLVTTGPDGYPVATLLPVVWEDDVVIAHMARANPHWKVIVDDAPTLLVVEGPQAYISPSWYPAKAEHGRVVPTWNYTGVQLTGRSRLHHEPEWLRHAVDLLTTAHEAHRERPWATTDAPAKYVDGQLRAIVGIEIHIENVHGKAKLSQNRSAADQLGVIGGLVHESDPGAAATAWEMSRRQEDPPADAMV